MNDCDLAEDLMPLYMENMLGETAVTFVKAHLAECSECQLLYKKLQGQQETGSQGSLLPNEKEKSVTKIVRGYKKWFYSIIAVAVICALLGGITGTYIIMKYEELVPNHIAQDFAKFALHGDRWIYQERMSQALKDRLTFDQYSEIRTWEEFEKNSSQVEPPGFKVYKNITAQEFGPFDVSLKIGLVLEKGGFRVFQVSLNNKAEYLRKKADVENALENKKPGDNRAILDIDKQYISIPPVDPAQGEYFVEGRILKLTGDKILIEQHMDTHSVPKESFTVTRDTVIARHYVVKDADYFRRINLEDLQVGDIIFVIFTRDNKPRAVAVSS